MSGYIGRLLSMTTALGVYGDSFPAAKECRSM